MRPEVRVIEPQQYSEPTEVNLSSSEVAALLAKYGVPQQPRLAQMPTFNDPNKELTFYELLEIEERKAKEEKQKKEEERQRELNRPQTYSFDRNNMQYYDNQYRSDDSGFGIQVNVTSNMPVDKGYGY